MKHALSQPEMQYLDEMFPDMRKRESLTPDEGAVEGLRLAAVAHARAILEHCPATADRSDALRSIRSAHLFAIESLTKKPPRV